MSTTGVFLIGLQAMGVHGVLPEERERAQPFSIDVSLHLEGEAAQRSDDLGDTVDYGVVAARVARIVADESYQLLERLAGRIADDVLAFDGRITHVSVTLSKLRPPLPLPIDRVGVHVRRDRA